MRLSSASKAIALKQKQDEFLSKYFYYYSKLTKNLKQEFLDRLNIFISKKKFKCKSTFRITDEVKWFVSASAIQLTFGQKNFTMPMFHTILVFENEFENILTKTINKGEVSGKGFIALSWKHFLLGYKNPNDRLNVGLHEFAHAFHLNIIHTNLHDNNLDTYLTKITSISRHEVLKIRNGENQILRNYAKTNVFEFFAVTVEHFFERPTELKAELPELYKYISLLLNQDPANNIYRGVNKAEYFNASEETKRNCNNPEYKTKWQAYFWKRFPILILYSALAFMILLNIIFEELKLQSKNASIILISFLLCLLLIVIKASGYRLKVCNEKIFIRNVFSSGITIIDINNILYIELGRKLKIAWLNENGMNIKRYPIYTTRKSLIEFVKLLNSLGVAIKRSKTPSRSFYRI